jgi:HJR/Mrr/RecB family endonuclease
MNSIPINITDVQITLLSVHINKEYKCPCQQYSFGCSSKQQLSSDPLSNSFIATEIVLNFRNLSNGNWAIDHQDWEMIDTQGFAYKARPLCDTLHSPNTAYTSGSRNYFVLSPGTQTNLILVFPALNKSVKVAFVSFCHKNRFFDFKLNNLNQTALDLLEARNQALNFVDEGLKQEEERENEKNERSFRIYTSRLERRISRLDEYLDSRFNKTLSRSDARRMDSSINKLREEIRNEIEELDFKQEEIKQKDFVQTLIKKFESLTQDYDSKINEVKRKEELRLTLNQKIEQLYGLSPREFEEYIAGLFKVLGFEKVTLTPTSNDKGVDIFAEEKGKLVAVQCKKYKGKIGRPELQKFLGAMQCAGADKGFFITTGIFTPEAEQLTSEHPIFLYDKEGLKDLIAKALPPQNKP